MARIVTLLLLLGLMFSMVGCQTLIADRDDYIRKYSRMADINRRMFNEDIENLLMLDRSSNLSQWYRTWH